MKRTLPILLVMLIATAGYAEIAGSFIQLNREKAERTVEEWREDFRGIKSLGGNLLVLQWVAEEPVLYFESADQDQLRGMTEMYPSLERIFTAAEKEGMEVLLGLQHHPEFWKQIKGREKVIQDFFRIRMARNEQLQRALLEAFGDRSIWTGYYIPDEIDDLTWRAPNMAALMGDYLHAMAEILRANDPDRAISISAFFRGRTAPEFVVENFRDMLFDTGIDYLLLQDGVGVGDPPLPYVHLYYEAFANHWRDDGSEGQGRLPDLWAVIETFTQVSEADEPFKPKTAAVERVIEQVEIAQTYFDRLILFTYDDYIAPEPEAFFDAFKP